MRTVIPHHVDVNEQNTEPLNLVWACEPCNVLVGRAMQRRGLGRRTRQFNPNTEGARTLSQWLTVVMSMKGQ